MKILIVHAHPEPASFTSAMHNMAVSTLRAGGHEVQVSDLYEMDWNPVARSSDFVARENRDYLVYAKEQRYATRNGYLAADIHEELVKLKWADMLILNFPLFWFSVPAIMKGWIDRVLVSGVCYGGKRFYNHGGLVGKKAFVSLTLGGQKHMFYRHSVHGPLETMLQPLLRGTLAYIGMDVLPPFAAWHVPYVSDEERGRMLQSYRQRLAHLANDTPLEFPKLEQFDETLRPLSAPLTSKTVTRDE